MNFSGTIRCTRLGIVLTCSVFFFLIYFYMNRNVDILKRDVVAVEDAGTSNLKDILITSIEVAELAGKEIVKIYQNNDLKKQSKGKTLEGVDDPITKADLISHCMMFYTLQNRFPKIKIISEEKSNGEHCSNLPILDIKPEILGMSLENQYIANDDITIWIDPLDATKEYTENKVQYVSTMVCVAIKGKPIIGVIHFPFENGKTSWAWVGKGRSKDLNMTYPDPEKPSFIISMSHAGDVEPKLKKEFDAEVISAAGSGYKILEVIKGKASIYYHATHIKKWDICAGDALLHSLNSHITTLTNQPISYLPQEDSVVKDGLIASRKYQKWYWENNNIQNVI